MRKLQIGITLAVMSFCAHAQATWEGQEFLTNGDFSRIYSRTAAYGKPAYWSGAVNWGMPLGYNLGVTDGQLRMNANAAVTATGIAVATYARQTFYTYEPGNYTVKFDYQFVGKDPYVIGDGLYVTAGSTTASITWEQMATKATYSFDVNLAAGANTITVGTLKGTKRMNMNILPDPTAYVVVDNFSVKHTVAPVQSVPEPDTTLMLATGVAALAFVSRRKKAVG